MNRQDKVLTITSATALFPGIRESWQARGLLWMFVRRNIKVRYTQTLLGSAWVVIQPLLLAGVLSVVMGLVLGAPSGNIPYPLFAFTGSAIWTVFQRAFGETSTSFAGSSAIIQKVYFPRIIIPLAAAVTTLIEFIPVFAALILTTLVYGRFPGLPIFAMPFYLLLGFALAFGAGLWVTVLDAVFRDLRLVVPSLLQLLLFASPVMYALSVVPAKWRHLYELNPLVAVIEGFRWSLISGAAAPSLTALAAAAGAAIILLLTGMSIFARLEQFAVDRA
jgi:lipopolysaccharide transport system permease protein